METVEIPVEVLRRLEDEAANVMEASFLGPKGKWKNREAYYMAADTYKLVHWYAAPECRVNHPQYNPEVWLHETPEDVLEPPTREQGKGKME